MKKIIVAGISDEVHKKFRGYCLVNNTSMAKVMRDYIESLSCETIVTEKGIGVAVSPDGESQVLSD